MEMRNRIKYLRKKHKISGIKLAEMLEISPPYFYDVEKGKRNLSTDLASKLSDIFKVTTDYLLCKTDINLYEFTVPPYELTNNENEKSPNSLVKESEPWYDIPIEELGERPLTYRGKKLNEEQRKHFAKLIQAAADMLKE